MTENDVKSSIIDYIRSIGGYCQRVNSGSVFGEYETKGGEFKRRRLKLADPGTPDIVACINGHFVGIEVKKDAKAIGKWQNQIANYYKTNKLSKYNQGAMHQLWEGEKITKAKGVCIMTNSIDRLGAVLKDLKIIS